MLQSVTLKNFQSHKDLTLEMGKLTMLTGASNSGKSAVLRALIGMCRNDSVDAFVTHGEKSLAVTATFSDGSSVTWEKGNGKNDYCISRPDGAQEDFKNVGANVPDEVADALGMTPIVTEEGKKVHVNVHSQLESPFLISDTPGAVAKLLGELTAASKLFAAVSEGNRQVKQSRATAKIRKQDLDNIDEQLESYADVDEQQETISYVGALLIDAQTSAKQCLRLETIIEKSATAKEQITKLNRAQVKVSKMCDFDLSGLVDVSDKVLRLYSKVKSYHDYKNQITSLNNASGKIDAAAKFDIAPLQHVHEKLRNIRSLVSSHSDVTEQLEEAVLRSSQLDALSKKVEVELAEAYAELDTCPSCGQGLVEGAKSHLLGEVLA